MLQSFSTDLVTALVLMIVAALLGGLLVWLLLRSSNQRKVAAYLDRIDGLENQLRQTQTDLDTCINSQSAPKAVVQPLVAPVAAANDAESEALARIQARASEVNFDRIGVASADEKDDLKIVKGIGPFIEKKLNSIGIYTFRQIASFTPEDEDKVNDVIEFFPGRIRRDEWAKQAAELDKQKNA